LNVRRGQPFNVGLHLVEDSLPRFVRVRLRYQVFGWLLLKGWGADGGFDTVTQQTDLRFLLPCSRIGTRIGERKDKRQHEAEQWRCNEEIPHGEP